MVALGQRRAGDDDQRPAAEAPAHDDHAPAGVGHRADAPLGQRAVQHRRVDQRPPARRGRRPYEPAARVEHLRPLWPRGVEGVDAAPRSGVVAVQAAGDRRDVILLLVVDLAVDLRLHARVDERADRAEHDGERRRDGERQAQADRQAAHASVARRR